MGGCAHHRGDDGEECDRHSKVERCTFRDFLANEGAHEGHQIPHRDYGDAGGEEVGCALFEAPARVALKRCHRACVGLIYCEICHKCPLPEGRGAQVGREGGRVHCHAQIDRKAREQRDHGGGIFSEKLKRGKLGRTCYDRY